MCNSRRETMVRGRFWLLLGAIVLVTVDAWRGTVKPVFGSEDDGDGESL
jgi:hypothetical protein